LVLQEQKVQWESKAVEVLLVSREQQEHLVVLDQSDPLVTKGVKERLVHPELEVQQELQELVDLKDQLVNLVSLEWLVPKVTLDQVVQKDQLVTKEQQEHEVVMDLKVSSEQLDQLEVQAPQDE